MRPPKFWTYDPSRKGFWPFALSGFACLWQFISQRRWQNGPHTALDVPVICVGNVNVGGTGKTPTVIEVVLRLIAMKKTPHVVTKGYKGRLKGPLKVDPTLQSAGDVGDEPLLLSAFVPTWIAKDRVAGAKAAVAAGADVVVLDDGMQSPGIAKDLTILVVDADIGFGNGCVIPSGPLREPVSSAVGKSDLLMTLSPDKHAHGALINTWPILKNLPHISAVIEPLQTGMDWARLSVVAFAGIGRPEKFFKTLKGLGAVLKAAHRFNDHQMFSEKLLQRLERDALALGAQLVTTEKDAVRLPDAWRQKVLTLPVRLQVHETDVLDNALASIF